MAIVLLVWSGVIAVLNLVSPSITAENGLVALTAGVLYLIAPLSIIRHLVTRQVIDVETLLGALAAYLLWGMCFAFFYNALGFIQSTSFFGASGDGTFPQDLFFSFTTLTTTGYGNLVPAGNPGQTLAVSEMLLGQLFLVTAIGKIVAVWRPARVTGGQPAGRRSGRLPRPRVPGGQPAGLVLHLAANPHRQLLEGVETTRPPSKRHEPATAPSTRKVHSECGVFDVEDHAAGTPRGGSARGARWRAASASHVGRNRTGAGVAASGSGAPGTSSSTPPDSSRKRRSRIRSATGRSAVTGMPAQLATSASGAGPKPPR